MGRSLGSINFDSTANIIPNQAGLFLIGNALTVTTDQIQNRYGRLSYVKTDAPPLKITASGTWADGGGMYYRDFAAAMMAQQRVNLVLGDGTRFEWVDCIEMAQKLKASSAAGTSSPQQVWAWTATMQSYEPYARDDSPTLVSLGSLSTGANVFDVSYSGTAFAEPTWQFAFTVPSGTTLTQLQLANAATGESCTWTPPIAPAPGSYIVLMDASGGVLNQTPSNNQYSLLPATPGRGVSLGPSGGPVVDVDYTGFGGPPTLVPGGTITIPFTAYSNQITATVSVSAGALTSATLDVLAPNRWWRAG